MGQHMYKQCMVCAISLGHRGSHPTGGGGHLGKCFMHTPASAGQCGTGIEQTDSVVLICVTPGGTSMSYPLKPQGVCTSPYGGPWCLWSILSMCHTSFIFSAFLLNRYSFIIRQLICNHSFIFQYHLLLMVSWEW